MAVPRSSVPRGTRVPGAAAAPVRRRSADPLPPPEPVDDPTAPRARIDYVLQRRATLRALFGGNAFNGLDVCDADTYLLRAARFHGIPTERLCPVCRRTALIDVTYAFGEQLGHASGSAVDPAVLPDWAHRFGEFRVYTVEVCGGCRWNHLLVSYTLGDGVPRRPPSRPRDLVGDV